MVYPYVVKRDTGAHDGKEAHLLSLERILHACMINHKSNEKEARRNENHRQ